MTTRAAIFASCTALVLVMGASIALGTVSLPLSHITEIFWALGSQSTPRVPTWEVAVVWSVRTPRVLLAAVAGGGLAIAGAGMQGLFRNPMADPGVLGVSGGAALGAVLALYVGHTQMPPLAIVAAAFAAALGCAYLVLLLSYRRGEVSTLSLLLSGVAVGTMAAAFTSLVIALSLSQWEVGREMMSWLMGGLEGRGWLHVGLCAPIVLASSVGLWVHARELNALATGELGAMSLGVDVAKLTRTLLLWSSLATAATVSTVGVVAFVGLIVPHIARMLFGADHRKLLPAALILGAIFLVCTDLLCRLVETTKDIRLGVITSLLGGPFFLYLLAREKRRLA